MLLLECMGLTTTHPKISCSYHRQNLGAGSPAPLSPIRLVRFRTSPSQGGDISSKLVLVIQGTYHPFDAHSAIGLNYTLNIRKCGSNDIAWLLTVEKRRELYA